MAAGAGDYYECDSLVVTVLILSYVVLIGAFIWIVELYHQTKLKYYIGLAPFLLIRLVGVSVGSSGCLTNSYNLFQISYAFGFPELAILESLTLYRFRIFRQFVNVSDRMLLAIAVAVWIATMTAQMSVILGQTMLTIAAASVTSPLILICEVATAKYSIRVVKEARKISRGNINNVKEVMRYIRGATRSLYGLLIVFCLIVTNSMLTFSGLVVGWGDMASGVTLNNFGLLGLAVFSTLTYENIVKIVRAKAEVATKACAPQSTTVDDSTTILEPQS